MHAVLAIDRLQSHIADSERIGLVPSGEVSEKSAKEDLCGFGGHSR